MQTRLMYTSTKRLAISMKCGRKEIVNTKHMDILNRYTVIDYNCVTVLPTLMQEVLVKHFVGG